MKLHSDILTQSCKGRDVYWHFHGAEFATTWLHSFILCFIFLFAHEKWKGEGEGGNSQNRWRLQWCMCFNHREGAAASLWLLPCEWQLLPGCPCLTPVATSQLIVWLRPLSEEILAAVCPQANSWASNFLFRIVFKVIYSPFYSILLLDLAFQDIVVNKYHHPNVLCQAWVLLHYLPRFLITPVSSEEF